MISARARSTWLIAVVLLAAGGYQLAVVSQSVATAAEASPSNGEPPVAKAALSQLPEALPDNVVKAWQKAGAEIGWASLEPEGSRGYRRIRIGDHGQAGELPAIRVTVWKTGNGSQLPHPPGDFAMFLETWPYTDKVLKELSPFKGLRMLSLVNSRASDAGIKELAAAGDLRVLDLCGGVTAEGLKHLAGLKGLEVLNCETPEMSEAELKEIAKLSGLRSLNLSRAKITSEGMNTLIGLKGLRSLNLSGATLKDVDVKTLASLTTLESLDLSQVALSNRGFEQLAKLKNLRTLRLSSSKVTDEGITYLSKLSNLQSLELVCENVTDQGINGIAHLNKLKALDLRGTKISDAGLGTLAGLTGLESLYLGSTKISDAGLKQLAALKKLKSLDLGGTQISDAGLVHLSTLTSLRELNLGSTQVNGAGLKELKLLKKLDSLDLSFTKVNDAGLNGVADLTGLRILNIGGTQVTNAGMKKLAALTNLRSFYVYQTKVTAAGMNDLASLKHLTRDQFPATEVKESEPHGPVILDSREAKGFRWITLACKIKMGPFVKDNNVSMMGSTYTPTCLIISSIKGNAGKKAQITFTQNGNGFGMPGVDSVKPGGVYIVTLHGEKAPYRMSAAMKAVDGVVEPLFGKEPEDRLLSELIAMWKSNDPAMRLAAIEQIGILRDRRASKEVRAAALSKDPELARTGVIAQYRMKIAPDVKRVMELFDPRLMEALSEGSGEPQKDFKDKYIGLDEENSPGMERGLPDFDYATYLREGIKQDWVRRDDESIRCFFNVPWQVQRKECVPELIKLLDDPDQIVRYWAVLCLTHTIEDEDSPRWEEYEKQEDADLAKWRKWWTDNKGALMAQLAKKPAINDTIVYASPVPIAWSADTAKPVKQAKGTAAVAQKLAGMGNPASVPPSERAQLLKSLGSLLDPATGVPGTRPLDTFEKNALAGVDSLANEDLGDKSTVTAMCQQIVLKCLASADSLDVEAEHELVHRLRIYEVLTSVEPGEKFDAKARQALRNQYVECWLHLWRRLERSIDPAWKLADAPEPGVAVPGTDRYSPGVDPEWVKESELRRQYEAAIALNNKKIEQYNRQLLLRYIQRSYRRSLSSEMHYAYREPPVTENDMDTLKAYLRIYVSDDKLRTELFKAAQDAVKMQKSDAEQRRKEP